MSALAPKSAAAILERAIKPTKAQMSRDMASAVLLMKFSDRDQKRMVSLLDLQKERDLTAKEMAEMESYRTAGYVIDVMQSQARQRLSGSRSKD